MPLPVAARRLAYRIAYRALQVIWRVRHPTQLGVKCLLTRDERILLVRHTYGHSAWDLPGGKMKRGEPPLRAAQREMREELGVAPARWTELGAVQGIDQHRRDTIFCYAAELGGATMTIDAGELAAVSWFDRTSLPADLGPYVLRILGQADRGTSLEERPPGEASPRSRLPWP